MNRRNVIAAGLAGLAGISAVAAATRAEAAEAAVSENADLEKIKELLGDHDKAMTAHDLEGVLATFDANGAVMGTGPGEMWQGQEAPLAIILLLAGLILTAKTKPAGAYGCLALALLTTPFIRSALPLASPLPEEQSGAVVDHLLTNIYRAFDFRQESAIYDQLAVSVSGEQLTEIYLGQRRALELENRGGARARVENVEVESIEGITPAGDGVDVHARWNVSGSVNHFGHTHYRQNAYDAVLRLIPVDGVWKITAIEVNEEKRVY